MEVGKSALENVLGIFIPRNRLVFPKIGMRIYAECINQDFKIRRIFFGHWRLNGSSEKMSSKVMNVLALYNATEIYLYQ